MNVDATIHEDMSGEDQEIEVAVPLPDGDYWKFSRRAADTLDAANLEIVPEVDEKNEDQD